MSKKAFIIFIPIVVLLVVVFVVMRNTTPLVNTPSIVLPEPASSQQPLEDASTKIELSADNVQAVVKSLDKQESYMSTFNVTSYWTGGQATSAMTVWKRGNDFRVGWDQNGVVKNTLISDGTMYTWYNDSPELVFSASLSSPSSRYADSFARLISYEELLTLPSDSILETGYVDKLDTPCIYVSYVTNGYSNYVNQIYVSVLSGLPVAAEIYEGDSLIYSMESSSSDLSTPKDDIFVPPSKETA